MYYARPIAGGQRAITWGMVVLQSTLQCPSCGHAEQLNMPEEACQHFYQCSQCGLWMRPRPGDCCVFCSYGDVPCPPRQKEEPASG
ncbi:GDCCVxC domain-containing (seleno)protein [Meiothermus cerbereus]|uniref:GDCCVxC domain-containing (seleno)protein n=1 Tax=Meiothermus cerbereus TaxID=65552 RepID=UPI003F4FA8EF